MMKNPLALVIAILFTAVFGSAIAFFVLVILKALGGV